MKKLLGIVVLGLLLSNCADYIAEKERLKLQKEKAALEQKRKEDKATCKYYGFKVETSAFSDCLMNLDDDSCDSVFVEERDCYFSMEEEVPFFDLISIIFVLMILGTYYVLRKQKVL